MNPGPQMARQAEVFAFLADPATHGQRGPVARIDTHGAAVFLAGGDAYKVKRAVRFPFMDFSTLEKRRLACENEIAVNRLNAPDLYLGVVSIARGRDGLRFGAGEIVEWAVHLRRFDENRSLDRMAERGEIDADAVSKLARAVAASHRRAAPICGRAATATLRRQMEETLAAIEATPDLFPAAEAARLKRGMRESFDAVAPLLAQREAAGDVRHCHGDLHLGNIVMIEGVATLFDAIEFDDRLAICDTLYDLAFLLMDLWTRGLKKEANLLFNIYFSAFGFEQPMSGLAALPLFLSLRAAIRAKVKSLESPRSADAAMTAQRYFTAAGVFLQPGRRHLVALGGLSGTGKTTLARRIAAMIGRPPGALHLRSDVERKRLFHGVEAQPLPEEAYRPAWTGATYRRLRELAALALAQGHSVILDAAHRQPEERASAAQAGAAAGACFTGLWLEAPAELRVARVAQRRNDASDAGPAIAAAQTAPAEPQLWQRFDASLPIDALAAAALAALDDA